MFQIFIVQLIAKLLMLIDLKILTQIYLYLLLQFYVLILHSLFC